MCHRLLIAGGNWDNGVNAGSRSRNANNYRWNTNSNIGCRFCADTGEIRGENKLLAGRISLAVSRQNTQRRGWKVSREIERLTAQIK